MPVITVNSQVGGGGPELGTGIAQLLEIDYVDRLVLAQAAHRIGATVEALAEKERHPDTLADRLARLFERFLERSAIAGVPGEPYLSPEAMDLILSRPYTQTAQYPITRAQELEDARFIEVTRSVIRGLASQGNILILGRGSNIFLADMPNALHVGLIAPLEVRIKRIMNRERISEAQAAKIVEERERNRLAFFKRFFKVNALDPRLYHLVLNTGRISLDDAAEIAAKAALTIDKESR